jgi:hypothetical protein
MFIHLIHLFISSTSFDDECDTETYRINTINECTEKVMHLVGTINRLKPELNPSAQRCLTRFFTGDFNF